MSGRRAGSPRGRGHRGSTLIETSATVLLLGVVLVGVYGGITSLTTAAEGTGRRLVNLDEARVLMASTTKALRTATAPISGQPPFVVAQPSHVQFYANLDNPGVPAVLVDVSVDSGNQLVETVTPPNAGCTQQPCTYDPASATARFVGRYLADPNVFAYLDASSNQLLPAQPGTDLSTSQKLQVRSVQITMSVKKQPSLTVGVTTLVNTVGLPNVYYQSQLTGG